MNDKCASGTGATIDKCMIKVGAEPGFATSLHFDDEKLHHVAAKCGVFAETDIVNLVKTGIPKDEVLNSLADAIVLQNLSVLTRGNTLQAARAPARRAEHVPAVPAGVLAPAHPRDLARARLRLPEGRADRRADLRAEERRALRGVRRGAFTASHEGGDAARFNGLDSAARLHHTTAAARASASKRARRSRRTESETHDVRRDLQDPEVRAGRRSSRARSCARVIGLDGGSTSSKAVLVDEDGEILAKAYQLSKGNPIQDTKELLAQAQRPRRRARAPTLECIGFGATGYAADVLEECVLADVNIVETVAHMMSAVHFFGDVDVICDIGGQDIKVLFMKNGDIQNFKLSNSCSAGNGMLLQAMADQFGMPVTEYAETAFKAELAPKFSYGCAVFLDTDRVNFQKEGFQKEELLAGLAQVLPKNVWQYVVQIPRLASLGRKFVLQGGTQYNLAAVKAQVDYIKERVPDARGVRAPAHRRSRRDRRGDGDAARATSAAGKTRFIGIEAALDARVHDARTTKRRSATSARTSASARSSTRKRPDGTHQPLHLRLLLREGHGREQGGDARARRRAQEDRRRSSRTSSTTRRSARSCTSTSAAPLPADGTPIKDVRVKKGLFRIKREEITRPFKRSSAEAGRSAASRCASASRACSTSTRRRRSSARTSRRSASPKSNVVFSDATTEEMWVEGGKYGSIDPCFPSKVAQAHVHNLLFHQHEPEREAPAQLHLLPDPHARAELRAGHAWTTPRARSSPARPT